MNNLQNAAATGKAPSEGLEGYDPKAGVPTSVPAGVRAPYGADAPATGSTGGAADRWAGSVRDGSGTGPTSPAPTTDAPTFAPEIPQLGAERFPTAELPMTSPKNPIKGLK